MPDVVGELIVTAIVATGEGEGVAAFAEATYLGVSGITVIGGAAILGAAIGLQHALNNPEVPKAENGAVPIKQAIPPRVRGYWINRLAGCYVLFLAAGADSQDMLAFHSGRIEEVLQIYLHDQPVAVSPAPTHGAVTTVATVGADQFRGVQIQIFYGLDSQNSSDMLNAVNTSGTWTSAYAGRGIACLAMYCAQAPDPETFTKRFRQGLPLPSVVAKCAPVFDPRDGTQSAGNPLTWKASPNPVLQLMDYLTLADGGMGEDRDILFPSAVVEQWMAEANLCSQDVGGRLRYASAGWYQFDNSPESVIGKILSTCDGWLAEAGDGTLGLTVGVYREPTEPPIAPAHILGCSVRFGVPDEEQVSQLDVSFTNPLAAYVSDQIDSVRDEDAISRAGIVRAKPLDLTWVQDPGQALILARRALLRLNPEASGTLVTTRYGMRYLGRRWVKVQFPSYAKRLAGRTCVIEIQDKARVDLLGGRVTFNWILVDPAKLTALQ
ncbi:hypothetical protein [Bradyrhizobium lablabi]|uniref:hypothetical protein n=1 Tax=Bradyrhizobium lablabi TaxID=722472 RepID=UPI001BA5E849|nr:hypothetical protein [Bradyrhizobium lablabi]MBR0695941.1 hypothetical protein [Bradyrhizobium lablabi]